MSAALPAAEVGGTVPTVCVQAVFHVRDDQQAQAVVGKMIDRAHEIANLPECECDVDVSVERARADVLPNSVDPGDALAHARTAKP